MQFLPFYASIDPCFTAGKIIPVWNCHTVWRHQKTNVCTARGIEMKLYKKTILWCFWKLYHQRLIERGNRVRRLVSGLESRLIVECRKKKWVHSSKVQVIRWTMVMLDSVTYGTHISLMFIYAFYIHKNLNIVGPAGQINHSSYCLQKTRSDGSLRAWKSQTNKK
jgi:hypothetical protein